MPVAGGRFRVLFSPSFAEANPDYVELPRDWTLDDAEGVRDVIRHIVFLS